MPKKIAQMPRRIAKRPIVIKAESVEPASSKEPSVNLGENTEVACEADFHSVFSKNALAKRMEGMNGEIKIAHGQKPIHTLLHLTRRFFRERQGENLA